MLIAKGVVAGIVNISGDINTWGKQLDGNEWKCGDACLPFGCDTGHYSNFTIYT